MNTDQTEAAVACPELEELAAMIDGNLSKAERDAVVEHLASCEACFEIYTETLRIQEDLGPRKVPTEVQDEEPPLAPVVQHPRSFGWAWRAAAALAAGVVVALGLLWYLFRPAEMPVAHLAEINDWHEHDWRRMRGPGEPIYRDPKARAFQLGVHAIDLEAAVRLAAMKPENLHLAESLANSIHSLLAEIDMGYLAVALCGEVLADIRAGEPPEKILESAAILEDHLTDDEYSDVDAFYYDFGKWTETSRLWALESSSPYFAGWEFKRNLRRLRTAELGEDVSQRLEKVRKLVESDPILQDELIHALEEIIDNEGIR